MAIQAYQTSNMCLAYPTTLCGYFQLLLLSFLPCFSVANHHILPLLPLQPAGLCPLYYCTHIRCQISDTKNRRQLEPNALFIFSFKFCAFRGGRLSPNKRDRISPYFCVRSDITSTSQLVKSFSSRNVSNSKKAVSCFPFT